MVVNGKIVLLFFFHVCVFLFSLSAASLIGNLVSDIDPCEDVCQKTYPLHTYEKSQSGSCCSRGCRLYSILELIGEEDGVNSTLKSCHDNCKEAYPRKTEDSLACVLGCNSQKPYTDKWSHKDMDSNLLDGRMSRLVDSSLQDGRMSHLMNPWLYMHSLYNNMVNQVTRQVSVSWSFFVQDGTGRMVVVKSQPQVIDMDMQDLDDYSTYRGTSSVLETNIEPVDKTATEVMRHSQLKSATHFRDEINAAKTSSLHQPSDGRANDWLTCIAYKTGVPRLLISTFVLLSAVALIWLCASATCASSPELKFQQKLSIRSDLDYLRTLHDKNGIKGILPQDVVEARPLPLKLVINQI